MPMLLLNHRPLPESSPGGLEEVFGEGVVACSRTAKGTSLFLARSSRRRIVIVPCFKAWSRFPEGPGTPKRDGFT